MLLISHPGDHGDLEGEQKGFSWTLTKLNGSEFWGHPVYGLCHICYSTDLYFPKQTQCVIWDPLNWRLLHKEQVAIMATKALFCVPVVPVPVLRGSAHSHSWPGHFLYSSVYTVIWSTRNLSLKNIRQTVMCAPKMAHDTLLLCKLYCLLVSLQVQFKMLYL